MKILVTGGAGFIGSALVRHLINETNFDVINIDKLTYAGNLESLVDINDSPNYVFEKIDLLDKDKLQKVIEKHKPNIIMHLAAESHVDRSINGPSEFIYSNVIGTFNLLEAVRGYLSNLEDNEKDNFLFHHISTDEVYGDLPHPDTFKGSPSFFTELSPYLPSSPYSASKASSDHLVRAWNKTYKIPTIITNCSNNYGPYHFPEKLIPLTILNALEGKEIPIYGKGNQIRDWLYVEDHAKALIMVATKGKIGETYNIGGFNEKRNIDVVNEICSNLNIIRPPKLNGLMIEKYEELITFVKDRPGHDMRYAIDATKIKNELGWLPEESFESGIKKTILWYIDNLDWCRRVQSNNN